jgi:uncharacterized SAM-binding protein YcdF (DUF218 family)
MTYYVSKVFWLLAAPTGALVLISAIAALWAVLGSSNCANWLAAAAACVLVIGAFTPIGLALTVPLANRFPFSPPDSQAPPDGIIILAGGGHDVIDAVSTLSQDYPKARLTFSGFSAADKNLIKRLANLGSDPARINMQPQPRTTSEDALYSAALLKPKPSERWLLVTSAMHMPRAVGCFRAAGFQVEPYPVEPMTGGLPGLLALFATGSSALIQFDRAVKEWIGLIAYRLMGKTDALFPGPSSDSVKLKGIDA